MDNISGMEQKKENNSHTRVEIIESGPINITGNFHLRDLKRNKEDFPGVVSLCRCGKSAIMPFCDDSHKK
jgi:CDGSH-type Zn-finger protein